MMGRPRSPGGRHCTFALGRPRVYAVDTPWYAREQLPRAHLRAAHPAPRPLHASRWALMRVPTSVRFADVAVIRDGGTALLCMIEGREVWVPVLEMQYGSEVAKIGDCGRLVISRQFAEQVGLRGRPRT